MNERKTLKRAYKEAAQPMGVYRVYNRETGRSLLGSSLNVPGTLNRIRFELRMGNHNNRELQKDWQTYGSDAFDFETLETLEPADEPDHDHRPDLAVLEELWRDKLNLADVESYGTQR